MNKILRKIIETKSPSLPCSRIVGEVFLKSLSIYSIRNVGLMAEQMSIKAL